MRLLDLFCGAGGAAMGYHRAGFEVAGVDLNPQPHYPFEFHQADALTFPLDGFDAIHASPPCQAYTRLRLRWTPKEHPDLVAIVRSRLRSQPVPWVIENVPGAPMSATVVMCGSTFGLGVRRHRLFESSILLVQQSCDHAAAGTPIGVYGHTGGSEKRDRKGKARRGSVTEWSQAMGIDWMTAAEMTQAIPPAYTEWIGRQLATAIETR